MRIKQPALCERCIQSLTRKVERDVATCRIETLWCPHSAVLAICVVDGAQVAHMTVQGPLTDAEAQARLREYTEGIGIKDHNSVSDIRQ